MEPKKRLVEPFSFRGNRVGCLLIHGFTGSPSEMRFLGECLANYGWTVLGIRLAGHGSTPEKMAKTRWEDWTKDAEAGVRLLRKSCDTVIGIGLSMGGLLTLHLAEQGLIDGLVSMNAPIVLADRRTRYIQLVKPFKTFVGKPQAQGVSSSSDRFVYDRVPVDALISLNRAIRTVRKHLNAITCPTLLMQSMKDQTVKPMSVEIIKKGMKQIKPDVRYWGNAGHILPLGQDREAVAQEVDGFLRRLQ